jgi:hypothetical protein
MSHKIIWVASYPRSGNTWIRFLLANLLCASCNNSQELSKIIPDVHDPSSNKESYQFNDIAFLKTHWTYEFVSSLNLETIGAIYIYRNPLDVIASHINYCLLADNITMKNTFIQEFIFNCGAPQWLGVQMGTWIENTEGWVFKEKKFPCLVLRYEDLRIDPHVAVKKICRFLGLNKDSREIEQAIKQSSFGKLRNMEEQELKSGMDGFFKSEHVTLKGSGYRFMYKGAIGSFKELLSSQQIKQVIERFGVNMEKLGYSGTAEDYL